MDESQDSAQLEENVDHFGFRDGNLFVIDVAPEMFETNPETGQTHFVQCLHSYGRILSQKLMWNKRDWVGLVFYNNTKDWDRDPETEHILTVQKFAEVESNMLRELLYILEHKVKKEDYNDPSSNVTPDNCLHDVLWQACRSFDSIKIAMPVRQVVLLTRRDNPLPNDAAERHKIRLRAKTYRDINVNLRIIGLGNDWNHELFYKDIDVLANNIEADDTKRMKLIDLEVQVRFPSRTSGHLKWRIGKDMQISTFLTSFSSKTKYLKKARMHKDTNEILEVYKHWGPTRQYDDDSDDEINVDVVKTQVPDYVRKCITFGDRLISFLPKEVREIRVTSPSGINLIGFKPISLDLIYHIKSAKFVGVEDSASKEEKDLFAALFSKCEAKQVMAICSVSHRAGTYLGKMIPCSKYGGFYLCKIPFREQINGLDEYTKSYIYDENDETSLPIDETGIDLMTKVIKKLRINWDPYRFTNPGLNRQLAYIETLALDIEASKIDDPTLPDKAKIETRLANLAIKFENMFGDLSEYSTKREGTAPRTNNDSGKVAKFDDQMIRGLIRNGTLSDVTVPRLRSFARSIGVQVTGLKSQLVERITAHYETKDAGY